MSYKIGVRIPEKQDWIEFREYVKNKHGQIHSMLGYELTRAIEFYMKYESKIDLETGETIKINQELNDTEKVISALKKESEKVDKINKKELYAIIFEATKKDDQRKMNHIIKILEGIPLITPLKNGKYSLTDIKHKEITY